MAHCEKFKATQVNAVCKHDSRQQDDGVEHSNESIDNERTHLNYNIAGTEQQLSATDFLKKRLSECKVLNRADVNVMCSWAVTLPKDFNGDERKFFEQTYKFLCERYGKQNVISAWVHKDENQPHLHFKFVPVTQGKDGKDKVSAKDVVNRSDLRSFHKDLQRYLENVLQCPCNVLNGATVNGDKTVEELKLETLKSKNVVLNKQIDKKTELYEKMTKTLSNKELKEIDTTPQRIVGGFKGLSPRQAQELVNTSTALKSENRQLRTENKQLKEKNKELKNDNTVIASELESIKQERQARFSREKLEKIEKERKQKERMTRIENECDRLKDFMSQLQFQDGSTALDKFLEQQNFERKRISHFHDDFSL